jgi:alpha/beta superfamily hydrolase
VTPSSTTRWTSWCRNPSLVFQGLHDTVVNPQTVERWSATRPNVELQMLDDDHQMHASLDDIWVKMEPFLFP